MGTDDKNSFVGSDASVMVSLRTRYATRDIEAIKAGDIILARDQFASASPVVPRRVEEVFERTAYGLTVVTLRSSSGLEQSLYSTNEHPIYVPGRGWMVARELEAGDELLEPSGGCPRSSPLATSVMRRG